MKTRADDRLSTALPSEFIRTRNMIARDLAKAGRSRQASLLRRRRKPTVPVWAHDAGGSTRAHGTLIASAMSAAA